VAVPSLNEPVSGARATNHPRPADDTAGPAAPAPADCAVGAVEDSIPASMDHYRHVKPRRL
jgi:hypothetical protein